MYNVIHIENHFLYVFRFVKMFSGGEGEDGGGIEKL